MDASKVPENTDIPTLHHLDHSQSQRILWLLEELNVPYNLSLYERVKGRAPPSLKAVHPLGKSPLLELPDKQVISESSAIITYLLRTYDTKGRFVSSDWVNDEILTSFASSTLGATNAIEVLLDMSTKLTPWPLSYITRAVWKGLQNAFTAAEFQNALAFLEQQLGDKPWFSGEAEPGRCDFMMSWPTDIIAHRGWVDFEKRFPKIYAWRNRIVERDAWKRGVEKGNGYDLSTW